MDKQYFREGKITVSAAEDTASAKTVTLGFSPSYVKAFNYTDVNFHEHFDGMTDDYSVIQATAGDTTIGTSGGITLTANGFTLGSAIIIDEDDVVYWIAMR